MNIDKIVEEFRNERSEELFHKLEIELMLSEKNILEDYINDYNNPIWKAIILNNSISDYEVNNIGQIRKISTGKIISKYVPGKNTYRNVSMIHNKREYHRQVHRLVAEALIPNPENKPEVNHINGDKQMNWVGNLEWNTRLENAQHAAVFGLMLKGSKQPVAKYKESDAIKVCKLAEKGYNHKYISTKLNVSDSFVVGIMFRNEWKHISSKYNIPSHKKFADKNTIHEICKRLSNSERIVDISNELNVPRQLVDTVKQGKAWRRISNEYNIPGLEKDFSVRDKKSDKIRKFFDDGIFDTDVILARLNIESSTSNKKYIAKLRLKYNNAENSETIEPKRK